MCCLYNAYLGDPDHVTHCVLGQGQHGMMCSFIQLIKPDNIHYSFKCCYYNIYLGDPVPDHMIRICHLSGSTQQVM